MVKVQVEPAFCVSLAQPGREASVAIVTFLADNAGASQVKLVCANERDKRIKGAEKRREICLLLQPLKVLSMCFPVTKYGFKRRFVDDHHVIAYDKKSTSREMLKPGF
jgi:hypothetical protein